MKIAIYWKSNLMGGTDTHLIGLLKNWPEKMDGFTIFYNINNQGYTRISKELENINNVKSVAFSPIFDIDYGTESENKIKLKFKRLAAYLLKPFLFIMMVRQARFLFKKYGSFDALLSDDGGYPAAWECLASVTAAKQLNFPKRLLLIHHAASKPGILTWRIFELYIDKKMTRDATDIIAVSQATRNSILQNRFFNNIINPIRVIYNSVELNDKTNNDTEINIRKEFKIKEPILVGIVGRVERVKGHEDLLTGYSLLSKEQREKIKLVIIGSGAKQEINRLSCLAKFLKISDNLIFTGYINGSSYNIISQLNLLTVMSKDFEGFGLTLAEAMVTGVPVLATRVGAIPEFVNESIGTLIYPESPFEIFKVLSELIVNPEKFKEKAHKASIFIKNFSFSRMTTQFNMILKQ